MEEQLGERLIQAGILKPDQVAKAVERQKLYGGRLGTNLVALGYLTNELLDSFLRKFPGAPKKIDEKDLPQHVIVELILKTVLGEGEFTIPEVCERTKLPLGVVDNAIQILRRDRFVEVKGGTEYARTSYQHVMTSAGRTRAMELLELCQYVGPAPVSLEEYRTYVLAQTIKHFEVNDADVRRLFSHLTISESMLKRIGPAVSSGRSMFLYGPPGNGKTTIAQTIGGLFSENIYIPYALYVGGQIVMIYDPVNHELVQDKNPDIDKRWVLVKRPMIMVGGELTLDMLQLKFNPISKFYDAPLQMKANNGLFVVDDFGRQLVKPHDLLNRWIVPLDRRTDFMSLHTGLSFEIPFDQLVIFSTNIEPRKLVDEAFLRRIKYKIKVDYPTAEQYRKIFLDICAFNKIEFNESVYLFLLEMYRKQGVKPNACHPRDLIDHIVDYSHYFKTPTVLTKENMELAWLNYIVD